MKQRKLLWLCIPVIILFFVTGYLRVGKNPDLSLLWPERQPLLAEGRIYKAAPTSNAFSIYLKDISILTECDNALAYSDNQIESDKSMSQSKIISTGDAHLSQTAITISKMNNLSKTAERSTVNNCQILPETTHDFILGQRRSIDKYLKKQRIIIYLKEDPGLSVGDYVQVQGKCFYPHSPTNPGGFDSASYYGAQNICMMLRSGEILRVKKSKGLNPGKLCYILQKKISSVIDASSTDVEGAVLKSILLGDRSDLDPEVKELYQDNGIIHVLAISGLHISLIGMSLYSLLRKKAGLSFVISSCLSFLIVISYGFLTGFPTSSVRAILMFLIYLGAEILGRTYDMPNSMALTCVLMLVMNPLLITQSGFQLSFGAVLGVLSAKIFTSRFLKKTSLGISFAVWLMTLPITAASFYQIPLTGIILNLLVVPSMSLVVVAGILGTVCSFISTSIGTFLFGPVHYVLKLTLFICNLSRQVPGTVWITGKPSFIRIVLYYLVLYGGFYLILCLLRWSYEQYLDEDRFKWLYRRISNKRLGEILRMIIILMSVAILFVRIPSGFSVTFLDVGQGDGTCIHTETGHIYMVDGGSSSQNKLGTYCLEPYLKCMGYPVVDGWFISHFDSDHVNGLIEILEGYENSYTGSLFSERKGRVKNRTGKDGIVSNTFLDKSMVWNAIIDKPIVRNAVNRNISGITIRRILLPKLDVEEELQQEILRLAKEKVIPVSFLKAGDVFKDGQTEFRIYSPKEDTNYEDSNAGSMVMKVSYKDLSVLMTGDVQGNGEMDLLDIDLGEVDILKVAHHGSKNSSGLEILKHINPSLAIISVGAGNRYGHPNEEVLDNLKELGCKIRRTDQEGAITIRSGR